MGYLTHNDYPDLFGDVGEFHEKFGLDRVPKTAPNFPEPDVLAFRVKFLHEELDEFVKAIEANSLASAADALADLVYVALGTAHLMGIPFDQVWVEVHRANLSKVRAASADDERSKRGHALDVVKPASFVPPDHLPVLRALGWKGE